MSHKSSRNGLYARLSDWPTGETNMFNYHRVMKIANDRGMFQVVTWMYDNKEEYIQGILSGFTAKT